MSFFIGGKQVGKTNKGKELGNAIYQRANGTYEARYIDRFGKQRSVYGKTITEVGRKQREKIFENEKQINVIDTKMTLDEWYDKWITVCKKHCRTTTKRTYAIQYNRLRESLGWRKLTSLNLIVLQDAFNELGSDKSRSDCKALLVDILNRAVEADLLLKNPAIGINTIIDGRVKSEKRILSREEMEILLENSQGGMMYPIFVVALGTGMRIGELLALTPADINFERNQISITKTYYRTERKDVITEPKTKQSVRTIEIPEFLKQEIKQFIEGHYGMPENERLFPIVQEAVQHKMKQNMVKAGVKKIRVHDLRHSHVAYLINKGIEPILIKERLGHKDIRITLNTYGHLYPNQQRRIADLLDNEQEKSPNSGQLSGLKITG